MDQGPPAPMGRAVAIDVMLLMMFALPHSMMARPVFKKVWTRVIPPPAERSTYVLAASVVMLLLLFQWRPITPALWHIHWQPARTLLVIISLTGFAFTIYASFLINHFELFGLRQVWLRYKGIAYEPPKFASSRVYQYIRAPLMLGFLISFWVAPTMTAGRLLLAAISTAYVIIAVRWEERDLADIMGEEYRRYRARTPMLIPWPRPRPRLEPANVDDVLTPA
jgi:protein-S-isoprenylcysteine O-methyltransferase Ste14